MRTFASAVALLAFSLFSLHSSGDEGSCGGSSEINPEQDKVALGSTAMGSASPDRNLVPASARAVSTKVPDRPLKGQKRPPCDQRGQVEINGGCWVPLKEISPPCGKDTYEWKAGCFWPITGAERQPTSEQK